MKDVKGIFRNLENKLRQSSWFGGEWEIYNRGPYLQLYKLDWHNHNQGGVHFETYIEAPQIKQKSFPICMHAEEDCPSQSEFIRQFIAIEADRLAQLKGYKVIGQGYSIIERVMPLNYKNLEQRLYDELCHLRRLESGVEQALARL